jgi:hypothetical protein
MRNATKIIVLGVFIGLIVYDIFAFLLSDNATISVIITDWSYYTPWVPFVAGVLMGHWFWPAKGSSE